jgi:hypothetical protein
MGLGGTGGGAGLSWCTFIVAIDYKTAAAQRDLLVAAGDQEEIWHFSFVQLSRAE